MQQKAAQERRGRFRNAVKARHYSSGINGRAGLPELLAVYEDMQRGLLRGDPHRPFVQDRLLFVQERIGAIRSALAKEAAVGEQHPPKRAASE